MSVNEALDLVKEALSKPDENLAKSFTDSGNPVTGITFYDLEAPAKILYPVVTPLRNMIPRVKANGGGQANWRAVTAIDTNNTPAGVSEGNRAAEIAQTVTEYTAVYRKLGKESSVTREAYESAKNFQDLYELNSMGLLRAMMIAEEKVILGSFGTFGLAQPVLATPTKSATVGTLTSVNNPYTIYCIALTPDGFGRSNMTVGVKQTVTNTSAGPYSNTDTCNAGSSKISASASFTALDTTSAVDVKVAAVEGAAGYAWFIGSSGHNPKLSKITSVNIATITADASLGSTQDITTLNSSNNYSANSYQYDGLIAQAVKTSSGAYFYSCDGAGLTSDSDGGINEFNVAFQSFWDNYKLSPDTIWVSSQEKKNIISKILANANSGAQRFVFDTVNGTLTGGSVVKGILNPFSMNADGEMVSIKIHPNMPTGTILFTTSKLPYSLSNVSNLMQIKCRYDYMQVVWPELRMTRELGIYVDSVLQHYFAPSMGIIANIGNA
jgi:hypothetical protein